MTAAMMAAAGVRIEEATFIDLTAGVNGASSGFGTSGGFGSVSPSTYKGETIQAIRFSTTPTPDNFEFRLDNTGLAQDFFSRITVVGTDWAEDLLTADVDNFDDTGSGRTTWSWDLASHAAFTNLASYVVFLYE